MWTVVFASCAAAGAWLASRTDPFPPGVDDPGARPTEQPSAAPSDPAPPTWQGEIVATTEHRLHVGGACRSDWRGTYRMDLLGDGTLGGPGGVLTLVPDSAGCDFPQAQSQADAIDVDIVGTWEARGREVVIRMRFVEQGRDPEGSIDLGGLLATLGRVRPEVASEPEAPPEGLGGPIRVQVTDGNQGIYVATYRVSSNCRSSCG